MENESYRTIEKDRYVYCERQSLSLPLKLSSVSPGRPQILKGCATPEFCNLQVNTTLGPEASGFHLTTWPECNYGVPPTQPGALNLDSLRSYPFCPLWISLVFLDPVCSQGIPSPLPCSFQEVQFLICAYKYMRTHMRAHTPSDTPRSRKSH